ncbi:WYL domain-containing protein [Canibacter sp. lx-45]|uniref:helix-turn-helix transcriptional regulator n=1 Tax=Canibacter zhuwentaonis TaxID=2837491 RepID=UPI001BDD7194|nr:WYL domain-containing protein [Canibacter zhuwentaonis]MBT1035027.1 WYL domain-containing protein [Canibacter zhuwentaonis]
MHENSKAATLRQLKLMNILSATEMSLREDNNFKHIQEIKEYKSKNINSSIKKFQRDIKDLEQCGVKISVRNLITKKGSKNLYSIDTKSSFIAKDFRLESGERIIIRAAIDYLSHGASDSLAYTTFLKLAGIIKDINFSKIIVREGSKHWVWQVDKVLEAIIYNKNISFEYRKPDSTVSARTVSPQQLYFFESRWHLFCYDCDKKEPRVFLLSRFVGKIKLATRSSDHKPLSASALQALVEEIQNRASQQEVFFNAQLTAEIIDTYIHEGRNPPEFTKSLKPKTFDNGVLHYNTADYADFARELIAFNFASAVIGPPAILEELASIYGRALQLNNSTANESFKVDNAGGSKESNGRELSVPNTTVLAYSMAQIGWFIKKKYGEKITFTELETTFDCNRETFTTLAELFTKSQDTISFAESQDQSGLEFDGTFDMRPLAFTDSELQMLISVIEIVTHLFDGEMAADAKKTIKKLRELQREEDNRPSIIAHQEIDSPSISSVTSNNVNILYNALTENKKVTFDYIYRDGRVSKNREVFPLNIEYLNGQWRLYAYCYQKKIVHNFICAAMSNLSSNNDTEVLEQIILFQKKAREARRATRNSTSDKVDFLIDSAHKFLVSDYKPEFSYRKVSTRDTKFLEQNFAHGQCDIWNDTSFNRFLRAGCGQLAIIKPENKRRAAAKAAQNALNHLQTKLSREQQHITQQP